MRRSFSGGRLFTIVALLLILLPLGGRNASGAPSPGGKDPGKDPQFEAAPDQLVVGFRPDMAASARASVVAARGARVLRNLDSINAQLIQLPKGAGIGAEAAAFRAAAGVRYAEPNYLYRAIALPDDPGLADLWGLRNTGQVIGGQAGTPGADIAAAAAWDITTGSRDVVVGVVDTGIDYRHADLAANVWAAPAGWSLAGCGPGSHGYRATGNGGTTGCDPLDDHDHGTHVAGTIGAVGDNGVGVVGVNWQVSLMGLKFLDATGSGYLDDAVAVIDYAVRAKQAGVNLRVLSNSWTGGGFSQALLDAINLAGANDILFVAAAGNESANNDLTVSYPAGYAAPNVVAVAATDNRDGLASFSNRGVASVHLGAPGADIRSTVRDNRYAALSGTSMATPHVAGAAALILAAPGRGGLTTAQLKDRLLLCGDAVPALGGATLTGRRLDVAAALAGCAVPDVTLNLVASPGGSARAAPPGPTYRPGTVVTLAATPEPGHIFVGWMIDGVAAGAANPLALPLYADRTVVATFATPPANDAFPGPTVAGSPARFTADTTHATTDPGEPMPSCTANGAPVGKTVWYTFTPVTAATVKIATTGSGFDTVLAVYTGDAVDGLTEVPGACNDDAAGTQSQMTLAAAAGVAYRVQIGGYRGASGALVVDFAVAAPPVADPFPGTAVAGVPARYAVSTADATTDPSEPTPSCVGAVGRTVWYTLTPAVAMTVDIATAGSNFDTVLAVYTGETLGGLREVPGACNDDSDDTRQSRVSFRAAAGTAYRVQVGGYRGASGDLLMEFTSPDSPTPSPSPTPTPTPSPSTPGSPVPSPNPAIYTLLVTASAGGTVAANPPGPTYPAGTEVAITAAAVPGRVFTGWTVDGRFRGWGPVLMVTMDAEHTVTAAFSPAPAFVDVPSGQAYSQAVAELAARGTILGYGDGTFGPEDRSLRAQMAALIARAMGYGDNPTNPFTDRCDPVAPRECIDDELWRRVAQLADRGIARGYADPATCAPSGTPCYAPRDAVLHAQVLSFITRAMVAQGYWTQQPVDPGLYGGVLNGTGHEQDVATYLAYTRVVGGVPDYGEAGGFAAWDQPSTRGWFARALWAALDSHWGGGRAP